MFGRQGIGSVICALLVSSHMLAGCTTLERLDKKSDELLDKVNDPRPTSSSNRSSGQTTSNGSGLSVVRRRDMSVRTVKDARGNTVEIWGQIQSSSTTPGHDATMEAKALAMALSGEYEYVTIQRSWRTATGRVGSSRRIPDIIGVRSDGRVDAIEVQSNTDKEQDLMLRLEEGRESLPPNHRGRIDVIAADPTIHGGLYRNE